MATARKKFESQEIFLRPMCMIQTAKDGKFFFEEEVLKQIENIDVPLVVVAIAGLYRTGKSYLMNRLAGHSDGFPLGSTIQSKTKGIWVWCKRHPVLNNTVLMLLDTEGLGDVAKGNTGHDNRIFTLTVLLCNVLVYNMMTVFNQDAVEKLTFISEMSKNIAFKNRTSTFNEGDQLELILPTFILCLRDFTLDLEKDGREISADEYLEDSLQLLPGKGSDIEQYNRTRESIRRYFPVRKCFTFDTPGNRNVIKQLDKLSLEELSETFVEETKIFLRYVYDRKPKVLLHSKPVTGKMFVPLVKTYMNAIRAGAVPDVDDAIMVVANIENERMAKLAVEEFSNQIKHVKLPILQIEEFDRIRLAIQNKSLAELRAEAVFNCEKFEIRAIAEMDKLWEDIKAKNLEQVKQYCKAVLEEAYSNIVVKKMQAGRYQTPGGHMEYKADIAKFKAAYKRNLRGTDEYVSQFVMNSFLDEEADNETQILMADQKLSAEDRKEELERMHQTHKEAQRQQQEMFDRKMLEERNRAEEHMRKLEQEREEYIKKEKQNHDLLIEQHKQQCELIQKQIELMKEENKAQRKDHKKALQKLTEAYEEKERNTRNTFEESQKLMQQMIEKTQLEMKTILAQRDKDLEEEKRRKEEAEQKLNYAYYEMEIADMEREEENAMRQYEYDQRINELEYMLSNVLESENETRETLQMQIEELKRNQQKGIIDKIKDWWNS